MRHSSTPDPMFYLSQWGNEAVGADSTSNEKIENGRKENIYNISHGSDQRSK